jgi:cation transport regulator ChaC
MWVFGYGSLIFRPAFPFVEKRAACLDGWARRFWQGSPDHRGTAEAPGRVVTLVREAGARCWGMAYRVAEADVDGVLAVLDHREQEGYGRYRVPLETAQGALEALVYVAEPGNPQYLGPAPLEDIARVVLAARGPSGTNVDYLLRLADALAGAGERDAHVEALARLVRAMGGPGGAGEGGGA